MWGFGSWVEGTAVLVSQQLTGVAASMDYKFSIIFSFWRSLDEPGVHRR